MTVACDRAMGREVRVPVLEDLADWSKNADDMACEQETSQADGKEQDKSLLPC